jgi:dipeptidyl aminopeptidase/acylaminoacyl peptidase
VVARTPSRARRDDELVESVGRLAQIGFCSTPSFSPDGSRIAFISDLSGTPQVWTVAVAGGWPTRVSTFPDQVVNARWSPTDDRIAVEVAPGGGLDQQLYVVGADGAGLRRLTPGGSDNNRFQRWSRDGQRIFISSNRDDPAAFHLFEVDVATGAWRPISAKPGIATLTDISRDGKRALVVRSVARGNADVFLIDLANGSEILLTKHDGQASYFGAQFGADGAVWVDSDDRREHSALGRIDVRSSSPGTLEYVAVRDDAELEGAALDESGSRALLVWNHAGRSELEVFDTVSRARKPGPALPAEIVAGVRWASDAKRIAVALTGSRLPVDIWTFGPESSSVQQITHSTHPGVDLDSLIAPRLETFRAHDGLELTGWLYLPKRFDAPGPCVLSFHGGPEGQERPQFNRTYHALLANGIAVFAPNVRGSAGFGKTFVHLDDREKRFDGVRDITACIDHVVKIGVADRKRIGITGGSYGGYMTMAGITEFPDSFAAAVCLCGIINFLTFFKHTQPWMAAVSKSEYGDPDTQRELLEALSPINKIDRARTPLLVLHGANDTNVPLIEAEQMVDELRKRNVEVASVIFPDEGHGFTKTANRTRAAVETVRWFVDHL